MGFREKIIVFGVLPWIIVIILLVIMVIPSINATKEKFATLETKEAELASINKSIDEQKDTEKVEKQIAEYKFELKGFNKQYPPTDSLESLYVDLQSALASTNITLAKLAVSKEKIEKLPKDFFEQALIGETGKAAKDSKKKKKKKSRDAKALPPITILSRTFKLDVVGEYQNVVDLLYYLNNYYRFISLQNISLKSSKDSKKAGKSSGPAIGQPKQLAVTVTFGVYRYKKNPVVMEEKDTKKGSKKTSKKDSKEEEPKEE